MGHEFAGRAEVEKVRVALLAPKRDWRFWAAVCAALLATTNTVAFTQILSDRNHWRDRFDRQSAEQLCRSVAAAEVNQADALLAGEMANNQIAIDQGLAAVAAGDQEALIVAVDNILDRAERVDSARAALDVAILAQQEAVRTCQPTPD